MVHSAHQKEVVPKLDKQTFGQNKKHQTKIILPNIIKHKIKFGTVGFALVRQNANTDDKIVWGPGTH